MWIASTFKSILIQLQIRDDVYAGKQKKLYEHSKKLLKDGQFLLVEKKVRFVPPFSINISCMHYILPIKKFKNKYSNAFIVNRVK